MHFGCAHNLGATSFFKIIQTILALFHFANFAFDIFCEILQKMRIKNMTIILFDRVFLHSLNLRYSAIYHLRIVSCLWH